MALSIVEDPVFREHQPGLFHPESPARLAAIELELSRSTLELLPIASRPATPTELERVHTSEYLARLSADAGQAVRYDSDTTTSPGSYAAAVRAAGAATQLAFDVATGKAPPGLALVRPPGHHALADRAMGFCLINNVAVAAAALRAAGLAERIAIYDFDVHHGNGTEAIFYETPEVLYVSTHQWPFYPGTGAGESRGQGRGLGATLNLPLPEGTDDATLLDVNDQIALKVAREFRPDFVLLSAGFDPYFDDPVGGFRVTPDGFKRLAARWRSLAEEVAGGRIAAVLEGGYHLTGLGQSVRAFLEGWM